mmetsp:Transcript_33052/g.77294  ORF Transcript_33052/g.77294 Transcript_33052/m.77294 type:complete len:205 (+) Transcript_33052:93-707(+)
MLRVSRLRLFAISLATVAVLCRRCDDTDFIAGKIARKQQGALRRSTTHLQPDWRQSLVVRQAETVEMVTEEPEEELHTLLVVLDDNPYLSGSTKSALEHVATGAKAGNKVTAMVLPATAEGNSTNTDVMVSTVRWWFEEHGVPENQYEELVPSVETAPAALVAEAAEELECQQVVMSAEAAAKKHIDIPLLATFLGCPLVLIPE